jgi:hypothetical protein
MVETITPVVHGGRRARWAALLALHAAGATVAAGAFGAALGWMGSALGAPWGAAGPVVVAALAAAYVGREALGLRVPVPQLRRQVPDWWRTFFGFGPASFLYGLGLGVGFLTYLTHGTLVVVSAAAVATGRPVLGMAIVAPFGAARGLSAIVAARARTDEDGSALVDALSRSASWPGWRVAHAAALAGVLAGSVVGVADAGPAEPGAVAAAVLAVAFGAAGVAKLVRRGTWRRALAAYRLPAGVERLALHAVPPVELALAALPLAGLVSTAGLASLGVLGAFTAAIALARVRVGRRLDCGCFGTAAVRDYRLLLARNGLLALAATVAWRTGADEPVLGSLRLPGREELLPAVLVLGGVAIASWLGLRTLTVVRRGDGR